MLKDLTPAFVQVNVLSPEEEFTNLLKKAEAGDPVAQLRLGAMYQRGEGVAKDDAQAVAWYRKPAEPGPKWPSRCKVPRIGAIRPPRPSFQADHASIRPPLPAL